MKLTKDEILHRIRDNSQTLREKYPIESIALFGSYARDEQNENSDIDILVDFYKPVGMEIVDLAIELENILEQEVDLVTYNAIKNRLFNYVKNDLIYAQLGQAKTKQASKLSSTSSVLACPSC